MTEVKRSTTSARNSSEEPVSIIEEVVDLKISVNNQDADDQEVLETLFLEEFEIGNIGSQSVNKEYMNICKVAKVISTNLGLFEDKIEFQVVTIPRKNICTNVNLKADKNIILSNPNITQYDLAVMDASYTLYVCGKMAFTPEMIVRTMSGNMKQTVSPQMIGAVTKSINKLKFIRIKIEYTDEMIARRKLKKGERASIESNLMPLRELDVRLRNQKIVHGYQFSECPVLYKYAADINQIISVPTRLFETNAFLSDTDEVIVIKRYLIRRIEAMRSKKNKITSSPANKCQ